jgi:hypothetical protein
VRQITRGAHPCGCEVANLAHRTHRLSLTLWGLVRANWPEACRGGSYAASMRNPYRYFNSSPEVMRLTVMMYARYPLSLRQVEDLLFERGIDIWRETVRFWGSRFGSLLPREVRKRHVDRPKRSPAKRMLAASELPSANTPCRDVLFPPLTSGRNPAECGHSGKIVRTTRSPR